MAARPWRELAEETAERIRDYPGGAPPWLRTAQRIFARRAEREEGPRAPAQLDLTTPPSEAA